MRRNQQLLKRELKKYFNVDLKNQKIQDVLPEQMKKRNVMINVYPKYRNIEAAPCNSNLVE